MFDRIEDTTLFVNKNHITVATHELDEKMIYGGVAQFVSSLELDSQETFVPRLLEPFDARSFQKSTQELAESRRGRRVRALRFGQLDASELWVHRDQ